MIGVGALMEQIDKSNAHLNLSRSSRSQAEGGGQFGPLPGSK